MCVDYVDGDGNSSDSNCEDSSATESCKFVSDNLSKQRLFETLISYTITICLVVDYVDSYHSGDENSSGSNCENSCAIEPCESEANTAGN